jgi:predicted amidohydrolase
LILAPEVCLSGFDYENLDRACEFSKHATQEIKKLSNKKTIILTMIEKHDHDVLNVAKVFKDGEVIHTQAKSKLFKLGDEHKFFSSGDEDEIAIFEVDGIKVAILICFELRFKSLWQKLEGADLILVPSWWGKIRGENFRALTQALAVMNQCYVVASDSNNKDCSGIISIITPFGDQKIKRNESCLKAPYDAKEVKKMRKYLDVGIG